MCNVVLIVWLSNFCSSFIQNSRIFCSGWSCSSIKPFDSRGSARADVQTDQQHSTSHILICWITAWATRCCAMPRSWFDFLIFIWVSNQIFLEFLVQVSSCLSIRPFDYRGSTVLRWIFRKWDVGVWTGSSWLRIETAGTCECGNKPWGSIKCGGFLD
jgi:hypothetical protein